MKEIKDTKQKGFGTCPDCIWEGLPEGCNVERDSKICNLNRKEKKEGEIKDEAI